MVGDFVEFFFSYFLCSQVHNLKAFDSISPFTALVVSVMESFLMVTFLMQRRANCCIVLGCAVKGANLDQFLKHISALSWKRKQQVNYLLSEKQRPHSLCYDMQIQLSLSFSGI